VFIPKHPIKVPCTRTQVQGTRDSGVQLRPLALHLQSAATLHYNHIKGAIHVTGSAAVDPTSPTGKINYVTAWQAPLDVT
jgi:hypothetical protein